MIRLGILGSTRGTNLRAIVSAIQQQQLAASIGVVVSNKVDAGILTYAAEQGLQTCFANPLGITRENYDAHVTEVLRSANIDIVVMIGYMRIVSPAFVNTWHGRLLNVHPSLLPLHAGLMDLDVHRAVIEAGDVETGCTVHQVTEDVDAGPVVVQKKCAVFESDTPEQLKTRVQALEGVALIEAISSYEGRIEE